MTFKLLIITILVSTCLWTVSTRTFAQAPSTTTAAGTANSTRPVVGAARGVGMLIQGYEHGTRTSADTIVFPPVTPRMHRLSVTWYVLDFVYPIYGLLAIWLLLATGASARMRTLAQSVSRRPFLILVLYMGLYTLAVQALFAPMTLWAGYWLDHHYGLSHEAFVPWLGNEGKGILLTYGERLVIFWIVFGLITRRPRRWEFDLWLILIPIVAAGIFAEPLLIDPLFNKFTPMPPSALRTQIQALADKAGIPHAPILVADMSRQTEETNAYVEGIGSSARIVLWDTTLKKMPSDQVLAIVGHEMGHYVLKHIYWGFAAAMAFLLVALPIYRRVYDWTVKRMGSRWRLDGPTDVAAIPVMIGLYVLGSFICSPLVNAMSRRIEHQADAYGLKVTGNGPAMARAFVSLSEQNLSEPNPPPFIQLWFGSHPTLQQRVDFVLGKSSPDR